MIVITGAAGFIGWNIYQRLKATGPILLVDFREKFRDEFTPDGTTRVMDPFDFLHKMEDPFFASKFKTVYHQGACSDTMNYDAYYMMKHNFDFSHKLLKACIENGINLIYASSAAVYGTDGTTPFYEDMITMPKNIYAKSKKLFDQYAQEFIEQSDSQIVGLRYFNVYGPWEHRKGSMSSVVNQFHNQIKDASRIKIFENSENYLRDFIFVEDVVDVNLHFAENPHISGIFNCGTGQPRAFADIPNILSHHYQFDVEEIEMPKSLKGKYQAFTQANLNKLIHAGQYRKSFLSLEEGIEKYVDFWNK